MDALSSAATWPPLTSLYRLGLALGVGLFVGLEREWRGKEAGLRTFGFVALLGSLGGMLGDLYAAVCVALVGILVVILNWHSLRSNQGTELTTSAALLVTGVTGVLCGKGHTITPTAVGVVTAGFLAWKERLASFSHKLTAEEVRSAILLAILAFAIYPVLPDYAVDPWGLIIPKTAFVTVIVIAAIGFINYVLLKMFGPKGMEITAFFGGLVNSRQVIVELTSRIQTSGAVLLPTVYRGVLMATASMLLRNALIVAIFAWAAVVYCAAPFSLMLLISILFWLRCPKAVVTDSDHVQPLTLKSPFRLTAAIKFGIVFMLLNVAGALAQRHLGSGSFYVVSILGGVLSSASSIASAATLISHHQLPVSTGVTGVILSSLTSILINIPFIRTMLSDKAFRARIVIALICIAGIGALGLGLNIYLVQVFERDGGLP